MRRFTTDTARTRRPGERGAALIMVILVLLGVSVLTTTMIVMSQSDHMIAANERDAERALFASRAGLTYGFYLFQEDLITPTPDGVSFNSYADSIAAPLDGGEFSAKIYSLSASQGQLYRIESTGAFGNGKRTTELVFQVVNDAFKFGYLAFNKATLHNHSNVPPDTFRVESTIFSNIDVEVPQDITLDGAIVAGGGVTIKAGATVARDVFANSVKNDGTIQGNVDLLTAVAKVSADAASWDRLDINGTKFDWYNTASSPGSYGGGGTVTGSTSSYTIQNGDEFRSTLFTPEGALIPDPDVNVVQYVAPPKIDYAEMKAEADRNDATYFTTSTAFITYLISKKVNETIDGKDLVTVKVGTVDAPEFIYVADDVVIDLVATGSDNASSGNIVADGMVLEGGMYIAGDFEFHSQEYVEADHPAPPLYYGLHINALPYCYPAVVAYPEPSSGTIASWGKEDTPPMQGNQAKMTMKSDSPHEGFILINGLTYSEGETHIHHTLGSDELVRFNGAELAYKIHNCDYFQFTYDPAVRCTRFLGTVGGTPGVVSFRETGR